MDMKLVAIVGTNSDRSTNRLLLQFMKRHFAKQADIELLEIKELPAFQESDEHVGPQSVHEFSTKIKEADGVIISTPEYDHAIPAVLKSALEWISYTEQALKNKPVMITGASLGALGSSRAQAHLRQILDSPELKARIMPSSEFLLGRSGQAFDADGQLLDGDKVVELEQVFAEFQQFVALTNQLLATHTKVATKPYLWEEN
jgi:NAD(P)H-dependent FMN reductase